MIARTGRAGDNGRKLLNLRKRISRQGVRPACGSGNFLVIAYQEMRAIESRDQSATGRDASEIEILEQLRD